MRMSMSSVPQDGRPSGRLGSGPAPFAVVSRSISSHQQWLLLSLPSLHICAQPSTRRFFLEGSFLTHTPSFFPPSQSGPLQIELGYSITLTLAPNVFGGRLCLNLARTTPEFPCGLVTFPHITLIFDPCRSFEARYTNATFLPR